MSTNPTSARSRRPAGTPTGGQFAPEAHAEPEVTLGAQRDEPESTREVDPNGHVFWRTRGGWLHRTDGPAAEWYDGTKEWFFDGELHREDGPAVEQADGDRAWYRYGQIHRDDGPAIERADGRREWFQDGRRHRDDGPAVEGPVDGYRQWWVNGEWIASSNGPGGEFTWRAPDGSSYTDSGAEEEWNWAAVAREMGPMEARNLYDEYDGAMGAAMSSVIRSQSVNRIPS